MYKISLTQLFENFKINEGGSGANKLITNINVLDKLHGLDISKKSNNITNNEDADLIIFMYLGGVSLDEDINEHWRKLKNCSKNKDKFKIIIHHQHNDAKTGIIDKMRDLWFNDLKYSFVNDDHHVGTEWATNSLVYATLLMMQQAKIIYGNSIKKFVLLSGNCVPLLNLDQIYFSLTMDSKSWLYWRSEDHIRQHLQFTTNTGWTDDGLFDLYENNYFSQWCAIDNIHADYFFLSDVDKTYIILRDKNGKKIKYCKTKRPNQVEVNKDSKEISKIKELQKLIDSFMSYGFGTPNITETNGEIITDPIPLPCTAVDEHYIGIFILYKLFKNKPIEQYENIIKNNLQTQTTTDIINRLLYIKNIFSDDLNEIENVFLSDKIQVNPIADNNIKSNIVEVIKEYGMDNNDLHIPGTIILNPLEQKNYIIKYEKNNKEFYLVRDSINIYKKTIPKPYKRGYSKEVRSKMYPVSCTYTNWDNWIEDPFNVLRSFAHPEYKEINEDFKLDIFLNKDSPYEALKYLIEQDAKHNLILYKSNKNANKYIKMPMYHPSEYTTWSFKHLINAYLLMNYCNKLFLNNQHDWVCRDLKKANDKWQNILLEYLDENNLPTTFSTYNFGNKISINLPNGLYIYFIKSKKIYTDEQKKRSYGNFITTSYIEDALATGSLFIRKVVSGTGINKYTDILCKINYNKLKNFKCLDKTKSVKDIYVNKSSNNSSTGNDQEYKIIKSKTFDELLEYYIKDPPILNKFNITINSDDYTFNVTQTDIDIGLNYSGEKNIKLVKIRENKLNKTDLINNKFYKNLLYYIYRVDENNCTYLSILYYKYNMLKNIKLDNISSLKEIEDNIKEDLYKIGDYNMNKIINNSNLFNLIKIALENIINSKINNLDYVESVGERYVRLGNQPPFPESGTTLDNIWCEPYQNHS